jgi:hypothetical protein
MDGVQLHGESWAAKPVPFARIRSSLLDDEAIFPAAPHSGLGAAEDSIPARSTADQRPAHGQHATA